MANVTIKIDAEKIRSLDEAQRAMMLAAGILTQEAINAALAGESDPSFEGLQKVAIKQGVALPRTLVQECFDAGLIQPRRGSASRSFEVLDGEIWGGDLVQVGSGADAKLQGAACGEIAQCMIVWAFRHGFDARALAEMRGLVPKIYGKNAILVKDQVEAWEAIDKRNVAEASDSK